jgi:hypothetical protein
MSTTNLNSPELDIEELMSKYISSDTDFPAPLDNDNTNNLSQEHSAASNAFESHNFQGFNVFNAQGQVHNNNFITYNQDDAPSTHHNSYIAQPAPATHLNQSFQQHNYHTKQTPPSYTTPHYRSSPSRYHHDHHLQGLYPQQHFTQESQPAVAHSAYHGASSLPINDMLGVPTSPAQQQPFPTAFGGLSPGGNSNLNRAHISSAAPYMTRSDSVQQYSHLTANDQARHGYNIGSEEQYPAELLAMNPYSFANLPYLDQREVRNEQQRSDYSSQRVQPPGAWHTSMSFEELITPDDVQMRLPHTQLTSPLNEARTIHTQGTAREVIILDSDSDDVQDQSNSNHAARLAATPRVLPAWDPSINDIDSANSWIDKNRDSLKKFEIYGDDADEVSKNVAKYAHALFNALQSPPPPPPQKCKEREDGVSYYNRYQQNALDKIDNCLSSEKTRKTAQANAFVAVQMAVDMHRNGLPLILFDDKRPWRLASSDRKLRCSERIKVMLKAVSDIKTVALEIADWDGPKVEDFVRNPKKTLHTRMTGISSNQVKKTRAQPAKGSNSQAMSLASSQAATPNRRMSTSQVYERLEDFAPPRHTHGDEMSSFTSQPGDSRRMKRTRGSSEDLDEDEASGLTSRAPKSRRKILPSNFGGSGGSAFQSNFMP